MPSPTAEARVEALLGRYGGLLVAGLGFVITRFFVAQTVTTTGDPLHVAATVGPLVVGLAMSIFGVALAVGAFRPDYVFDVTVGCLVGTGAMVLVLLATAAGGGVGMLAGNGGPQLLVANVLLGGAIGGIVNGTRRSAARRRREEVAWNADRARFINRLLRHEVLNAAAIADGHAEQLRRTDDEGSRDRSADAIRRAADRIETTVNGVGRIAEETADDETVDLRAALERSLTDAEPPSETVEMETPPSVAVAADGRLASAVERLLTNAVEARDADTVTVRFDHGRHAVSIVVEDDGRPLSESQRDLLERNEFPEYDDPTSGFDLQMVSLLVSEYGGQIDVDDGDATRLELVLPRAHMDRGTSTIGVSSRNLKRAGVAGIVAGAVMGALFWAVSGLLPVIGALYGVHDVSVGWVTHLFHSVVFALLFVAGASSSRLRRRVQGSVRATLAGLGWGVFLWLFAAGVLMPLWLQGVGMEAPFPNLPSVGLLTHGVWGVTLGASYVALGGRFE